MFYSKEFLAAEYVLPKLELKQREHLNAFNYQITPIALII